ncbi:hypothetical protein NMY22_g14518 [Coprinellus aureogranulatus]|nr:hypothetical protein NMY22_g14518 [Coprinellus aureogranulatus]
MSSLLRVAASLGIIKAKGDGTRAPIPTCIDGWNGLPEDIFNLMLNTHLESDVATARALSASCRAYATYSRSYIFRAIELTDPKAVIEFNVVLSQYSWVVDTPIGEALVSILSHQFTQLKSLELPYLHGNHQWLALSKHLEDAITSFLSRHTLQEISLTTHYPLQLLRLCPSIRKLECRIFPDRDCRLALSAVDPSGSMTRRASVKLQELVVQDLSHSIFSTFEPYLVHQSSLIDLANLESLTYHGDRISTTQLLLFLKSCLRLSTLRFSVDSYESSAILFLDLFHLTHLSHLTLSMDCARFDTTSADWIYRTLTVRLLDDHMKNSVHRLQSIHVIHRVAGISAGMDTLTQYAIKPVVFFSMIFQDLKNSVGLTSDDQPLEQLQRLQFSVVVDKKSWGSIGPEFRHKRLGMPSDIDWSLGRGELESQLLVQFMKDDRKRILEMADIGFLEDKFHRWLCL